MSSEEVVDTIKRLEIVPVLADWSDKDNWVISEFLFAMERASIPYYPIIPGKEGAKISEEIPEALSPPAILPGAARTKVIEALKNAAGPTSKI